MLRVDLIGPGDVDFHYKEILGIGREELDRGIEKISKALKSADVEIALLPDRGICFEIAKKFKQVGGRVIGLVPKQDKTFGIEHLREYIEAKVGNRDLFDGIIDTGDWFKHDLTKCLFGDVILSLGISPGAEGERQYGVYLYKIIAGYKKGVATQITGIHPRARAGVRIPYSIFIYKPFVKSGRVSAEDEIYAKKFGINLRYINSASDLEKKLRALNLLLEEKVRTYARN